MTPAGLPGAARQAGTARRGAAAALLLLLLPLAGCSGLPDAGGGRGIVGAGSLPVDVDAARRAIALYREAHGLGAVEVDPALNRVAQRQADAMARADTLSHTLAGDLSARVAAEGLRRGAEAENVSAGYPSFARALLGWQHSPGHDANLLFRPIRRIGIAAASAPGTRFKTYWALVMTD